MNLVKALSHKTTFIIGSKKNAGKTTFLNYALGLLRPHVPVAFLTIGIDGEKIDQVFGTTKPQVWIRQGDLFLTTDQMIDQSDLQVEIHQVFEYQTALGFLVLCQAKRNGFVELVGPEDNVQLSYVINWIRQNEEVDTILIDGAVNRVTQMSAFEGAQCVYVMRINRLNFVKSIETLQLLHLFQQMESEVNIINDDHVHFVSGALTEQTQTLISDAIERVQIEDFTKVFLSFSDFKAFCRKYTTSFRQPFSCPVVVLNISEVSLADCENEMNKKKIDLNYLINPYMECCG